MGLTRRNLLPNLLILGFLGAFAWLEANYPNFYYRSVQEDQALEWASFWSFFIAGGVFVAAALRQRRTTLVIPWFLLGLALFCVFVAMEEISWGQRVFGHRPPDYFLAQNYQQELNLHNLASGGVRLFVFRAIILGYGVLLPLVALIPWARGLFDRAAIVPPPIALVPSMFAMFWIHSSYPWKFTGEVVECGMGIAFLFAAIGNAARFSRAEDTRTWIRGDILIALTVSLALSTAWWSQGRRSSDPANLDLAKTEMDALESDLKALAEAKGAPSITACGLHKRLYTVAQTNKYARLLLKGSFANLVDRGFPESRAEFLLDPWNSPYWIRDRCDKVTGARVVFVYSYGPNRSRDSSRWEILGDDIGRYLFVKSSP